MHNIIFVVVQLNHKIYITGFKLSDRSAVIPKDNNIYTEYRGKILRYDAFTISNTSVSLLRKTVSDVLIINKLIMSHLRTNKLICTEARTRDGEE